MQQAKTKIRVTVPLGWISLLQQLDSKFLCSTCYSILDRGTDSPWQWCQIWL